jgi:hypothetical protein
MRVRAIKRNVKIKAEAMWIEGDLHRGHMVWTVDGISCSPSMPISGTPLGLFDTSRQHSISPFAPQHQQSNGAARRLPCIACTATDQLVPQDSLVYNSRRMSGALSCTLAQP